MHIVWEAAHEPMFILLFAAGLLYLILGEPHEGLFLFAMVLLMVGLTLYQEGKTERALEALRDISSPRAWVMRDGQRQQIDSREVVAGDLIVLSEGDRVPADGILISGSDMQVDESLLTGESVPVRKIAGADIDAADVAPARPGGDDLPFVYSGTLVVQGHGMLRVTGTGPRSEIGRIGSALQELKSEASPLQKQTARMVTLFALLGLGLSLLLVIVYGLLHGDWLQALLAGIALAMSMLPEEFPVVLTVFPALGAWRLARQQVLTRRLAAIETLGATSVLCVRQDRNADREPDDGGLPVCRRRTACRWITRAQAAVAGVVPRAGGIFDPRQRNRLRSIRWRRPFTGSASISWRTPNTCTTTGAWCRNIRSRPNCAPCRMSGKPLTRTQYVIAAKGAPEAIVDLCHLDAAGQQAHCGGRGCDGAPGPARAGGGAGAFLGQRLAAERA